MDAYSNLDMSKKIRETLRLSLYYPPIYEGKLGAVYFLSFYFLPFGILIFIESKITLFKVSVPPL